MAKTYGTVTGDMTWLKKWPIVDRGTSSVTIPKSTVRDVFRLQEPLKAVELVKKLLCMCRTLFLFIHFAVVLYDNNVKLVETCQLHVLWRKCRMCTQKILLLVFLLAFFHCPSFLPYCPVAVLISFRRYIMLFFQRNSSPLLSFKISLLALCRSSVLVELP